MGSVNVVKIVQSYIFWIRSVCGNGSQRPVDALEELSLLGGISRQ